MSGPNHPRGTSNSNARGSTKDRRRRKHWLLDTFGDGITADCSLKITTGCLGTVDITTITVDRIVPGVEGGTYARTNIRPACSPCNCHHGGLLTNHIQNGAKYPFAPDDPRHPGAPRVRS